jgi:hypothetical protein
LAIFASSASAAPANFAGAISSSLHRKQLVIRFAAWYKFTDVTQKPSTRFCTFAVPSAALSHPEQVDSVDGAVDRRTGPRVNISSAMMSAGPGSYTEAPEP